MRVMRVGVVALGPSVVAVLKDQGGVGVVIAMPKEIVCLRLCMVMKYPTDHTSIIQEQWNCTATAPWDWFCERVNYSCCWYPFKGRGCRGRFRPLLTVFGKARSDILRSTLGFSALFPASVSCE